MSPIRAYHRPDSVEAALELLGRSEVVTAPLGGGTDLLAGPDPGCDEVVDLQGLGLDSIEVDGSSLVFGACVTLRDLCDDERVPALLQDLARRDAPNTIRNAATLGGTVASADAESGLFAGLLVHEAVVDLVGPDGAATVPLRDLDDLSGSIITAVRIDALGDSAFAATARTPADTPIVAVAVRRTDGGDTLAAATGVAEHPVLLDGSVDPTGDFRGSGEYRSHLVEVLHDRALDQIGGAS